MKRLLVYFFFICIALTGYSQDRKYPVMTDTEGGRWEIVQSPIIRKCTIKLDKFTGKTYQLVLTSNGEDVTWQEIMWIGELLEENNKNVINYQIFMSGLVARDCFLINIHTGKTWVLTSDETMNTVFWSTIY